MKVYRLSSIIYKTLERKELPILFVNDLGVEKFRDEQCFHIPPRNNEPFFIMRRNSNLSMHKWFMLFRDVSTNTLYWENYLYDPRNEEGLA